MKKIKVLITAGPTWIPLDKVRVLTSVFTGRTGLLIAKAFYAKGFKVCLLLGPSRANIDGSRFQVARFRYFDELDKLVKKALKDKTVKAVIHSAAVSDYRPYKTHKGKIPSSKRDLTIRLRPTEKIIAQIKRKRKDIFLIQFKLEVGVKRQELISRAFGSLNKNKADIVVANDLKDMKVLAQKAYVIDKDKNVTMVRNRKKLSEELVRIVRSQRGTG